MTVNEALEIYKELYEIGVDHVSSDPWDRGVELDGVFTIEQLEAIWVLSKHYQKNNIPSDKRVF